MARVTSPAASVVRRSERMQQADAEQRPAEGIKGQMTIERGRGSRRRGPIEVTNDARHYIHSVHRATLPQEIVNSIADLIIRGVWRPGDMIPTEKELAARFEVGRSTVREAVKSLVVLGVLEAKAGEGSYVREPTSRLLSGAFRWGLLLSERNFDDLVEVRRLIECECARHAAQAPSPRAIAELYATHERMTANETDHQQFMAWDNRFHVLIADMTGNAIFTNIASTIQEIVRVWYPVTYYIEGTKAATVREHLRIAKAIKSADPTAAGAAMAAHLERASGRLKAYLEQRAGRRGSREAKITP